MANVGIAALGVCLAVAAGCSLDEPKHAPAPAPPVTPKDAAVRATDAESKMSRDARDMTAIVDRMCACKDMACFEPLEVEYVEWLARSKADPQPGTTQPDALTPIAQRMIACVEAIPVTPDPAARSKPVCPLSKTSDDGTVRKLAHVSLFSDHPSEMAQLKPRTTRKGAQWLLGAGAHRHWIRCDYGGGTTTDMPLSIAPMVCESRYEQRKLVHHFCQRRKEDDTPRVWDNR